MLSDPVYSEAIVKALDRGERDYSRSIRSAVYGLWSGQMSFPGYVQTMVGAIDRGFTRAWYQGAGECGIKEGELTSDESQALYTEVNSEISFIYSFADDIMRNSKVNKGKLTPLYQRAEMWTNRFEFIRSMARSMACKDQKLQWQMGPTKEHCVDCIRLNGRVYRASVWDKYGLVPRSHNLSCGGYRCLCRFVTTSMPVTSGRPPGYA